MTEYVSLDVALATAARFGWRVSDEGLLASALIRPQTTISGQDAYPDLATKAAAMLHSLVCNHALVDGNRRLGLLLTAAFLDRNGSPLTLTNDEAYDVVHPVADGSLRDVDAIAERLR